VDGNGAGRRSLGRRRARRRGDGRGQEAGVQGRRQVEEIVLQNGQGGQRQGARKAGDGRHDALAAPGSRGRGLGLRFSPPVSSESVSQSLDSNKGERANASLTSRTVSGP